MLILASTTLTGAQTFTSTPVRLPRWVSGAEAQLRVTSAAAAVGDTLDVFIQTSVDDGASGVWDDLMHFTQVLGNGGAKTFLGRWNSGIAPTVTTTAAPQDAALAAAAIVQGPKGRMWRVKAVVVSASAPVFTFVVVADFIETK